MIIVHIGVTALSLYSLTLKPIIGAFCVRREKKDPACHFLKMILIVGSEVEKHTVRGCLII